MKIEKFYDSNQTVIVFYDDELSKLINELRRILYFSSDLELTEYVPTIVCLIELVIGKRFAR